MGGAEVEPSNLHNVATISLDVSVIENGPHFFCQNVKHLHAHLPFFQSNLRRLQKAEVGIDHGYL